MALRVWSLESSRKNIPNDNKKDAVEAKISIAFSRLSGFFGLVLSATRSSLVELRTIIYQLYRSDVFNLNCGGEAFGYIGGVSNARKGKG